MQLNFLHVDDLDQGEVQTRFWQVLLLQRCVMFLWLSFQADVFSFGIILCEIIARIEADPDILPRTAVSTYVVVLLLWCTCDVIH